MLLRPATTDDLPEINAIYNHYVLTSTATWQTKPETGEARLQWYTARDLTSHPVMVVTGEAPGTEPENSLPPRERILAWSSLSLFGKREAFSRTVENSIYVHPDHHRRGLGRLLLEDQIRQAARAGHHTIIAAICTEQQASIALHAAFGFIEAGRLRESGHKFGRWLDLAYLQLTL